MASARSGVRMAVAFARGAAPHVRAAFGVLTIGLGMLAARVVRERAFVTFVLVRAAWWASLWLLCVHGLALADLHAPFAPELLRTRFVAGFGLCVPVVILGEPRSLRVLAIGLALAHASLAMLLHHLLTAAPS